MAHKEPDRVPMHMNATRWVLEKLHHKLGTKDQRELTGQLGLDTYDMRGLDLHGGVMPRYRGPEHRLLNEAWSGDILRIWGVEEQIMDGPAGRSYAIDHFPLSKVPDISAIKTYAWPDPDWFDYDHLENDLAPWSDHAIKATGCSVFQHATFVRGMDMLMMDMLADPDTAQYIFDRFFEFYYAFYQKIFDAAGHLIDVFALADDLATQSSLLISPEMFETFVAPRIKAMADLAHRYGIQLLLHSDGNVTDLIPRFIDLGVDILDPIQPEADRMDPVFLKKEYGKDLVFRGGISAQRTLAMGTVQEVTDETRRVIDIMAPGGGYILSPGHPVLQDDIPVDNIIAMYAAAGVH